MLQRKGLQTHGLPPEEPGREEDSPEALMWDRESYATWWEQQLKNDWKMIDNLKKNMSVLCSQFPVDPDKMSGN